MINSAHHKPRALLLFFLFLIFFITLIGRLFWLQIYRHSFFTQLAQQQYHTISTHHPIRAPIYDRHGTIVATNKQIVSAFIIPRCLRHPATTLPFLQNNFPAAYERYLKGKDKLFLFIERDVTAEHQTLITSHKVTDIQFMQEHRRLYPVASAGTVVGVTSIDNQGLSGIELMANKELAGSPGIHLLMKDARSGQFYLKRQEAVPEQEGAPITLTIDAHLQFLVHEELSRAMEQFNAKEAAAVIINPHTGEILAMASVPDFDPNQTKQIDPELMKNRVITECFEFGSVFKIVTALAALAEHKVTPDELIDCKGSKSSFVQGRPVNTTIAHGRIPFSDVIAYSNNIGIALVATRLQTALYDHLKMLGIGTKTTAGLPGEQAGFVNPPHLWSKHSIISLSYGYELNTTLLRLANIFCTIANNGCPVQLSIIHNQHPPTSQSKPLYSQDVIDTIKQLLERTAKHGTAHRSAIAGYRIMSKTGTANLLNNGVYDENKNLYTCAGIVEKGAYCRVIATYVKESDRKGIFAATVAAPLFRKIAARMIVLEKVIE